MKNLLIILAVTGILMQNFSKVILYLNYEANKNYIALNLCENRSKPKMHCNGKCHMMKQMKKDEGTEKNSAGNSSMKEKTEVQFISGYNSFEFIPVINNVALQYFHVAPVNTNIVNDIFQPPRQIV